MGQLPLNKTHPQLLVMKQKHFYLLTFGVTELQICQNLQFRTRDVDFSD